MLNGQLTARRTRRCAWVLSIFALCAASGAAAQSTAPAGGQSVGPPSGPIDEIRVRGTRSLAAVQDEAGKATEAFYRKLNTVIPDKEYQVSCDWETGEGSFIRRRVCRSGWQDDLLEEVGKAAYEERPFDPAAVYFEKQRIFQEKLLAAINTDPELVAAVRHLISLPDEISALNGSRGSRVLP
jgi:hypothetical protein